MRMEDLEMNSKIIRLLIIIGIILIFSITQVFLINEQGNEIQDIKNSLTLLYQEYDYYNDFEINSEAMAMQEQALAEIESISKLDFTTVMDKLQRSLLNHGWRIISFQRLEEEPTEELSTDALKASDSNKLVTNIPIGYEVQFIITNESIVLPLKIFEEVAESIRIKSITILQNDEEIHGVLNITFIQCKISEISILEI